MRRSLFRWLSTMLLVILVASACGSDGDGPTEVGAGSGEGAPTETPASSDGDGEGTPIPVEPDGGIGDGAEPLPSDTGDDEVPGAGTPIPVEPDGGIGDGADPLPGAEPDDVSGDWHGAEVAITNCPGVEFQRVEASAFSFSVPLAFANQQAQGIDSEVGQWSDGSIDVLYDYGWYSAPVADIAGADVVAIDYSGIVGDLAVVAPGLGPAGRGLVGVYFPVVEQDVQPNRLGLIVQFDDPADEIIARCIVGSIEWKVAGGE